MRLSKFLLPLFAFACLASRPAHADGTDFTKSAISFIGIWQTFPGTSKMVNGVKVYTEGTPLLVLRVKDRNGENIFPAIPFIGKKAEAFFDIAKLAGQREFHLYFSDEYQTPRTNCAKFAPEGCVELETTSDHPTLQYILYNP